MTLIINQLELTVPVRLTSRGPFLVAYDQKSKKWVTIKGIAFCVLSQYVDIEPGTTLERVFDMVESDKELKQFLGEYTGCNIDDIHKRTREGGDPIRVITDVEAVKDGGYRPIAAAEADAIAIQPFFYVYTDEATGEKCLEGNHMLMAKSFKNWEMGTTIHSQRDVSFGTICKLELRLDRRMRIVDCDEHKPEEGETVAFEATIQYTLLDVLIAVYGVFGEPPFDQRYQRQVDEDEAFFEQIDEDDEGDADQTSRE